MKKPLHAVLPHDGFFTGQGHKAAAGRKKINPQFIAGGKRIVKPWLRKQLPALPQKNSF